MPVTHTHTTTELTLAKFSSKSRRSDGSQADWVHWASPTLLISLAVSAAPDGSVNAANLSVVWRRDTSTGRGEITLEELDLLSFSNFSPSPLQIRPLRAVYSGSIVGIRYMHPLSLPPSSQPSFNQIQVRFQDASDASQFVAVLGRFCPCKEEPASRPNNAAPTMGPPPAKRQVLMTRTPSTVLRPTFQPQFRQTTPAFTPMHMSSSPAPSSSSSSQRPVSRAASLHPSMMARHQEDSQMDFAFDSASQMVDSSPAPQPPAPLQRHVSLAMPAPVTAAELTRSISELDSAASAFSTDMSATAAGPVTTPSTNAPVRTVSDVAVPPFAPTTTSSAATVPSASGPTNSSVEQAPAPAPNSTVTPADSILATLREVPALYQLTTPQLERAVGELIREPGFMEFLSRVEGMWRIRGLVGR